MTGSSTNATSGDGNGHVVIALGSMFFLASVIALVCYFVSLWNNFTTVYNYFCLLDPSSIQAVSHRRVHCDRMNSFYSLRLRANV